jgi:hypothetical protein
LVGGSGMRSANTSAPIDIEIVGGSANERDAIRLMNAICMVTLRVSVIAVTYQY